MLALYLFIREPGNSEFADGFGFVVRDFGSETNFLEQIIRDSPYLIPHKDTQQVLVSRYFTTVSAIFISTTQRREGLCTENSYRDGFSVGSRVLSVSPILALI